MRKLNVIFRSRGTRFSTSAVNNFIIGCESAKSKTFTFIASTNAVTMKRLLFISLLFPVLGFSQAKDRIPYKSYDFLKLVNKYYKNIPVLEEGFKSYDASGYACYMMTTANGDLYYLYENNVLKFNSADTSVEVYQVGSHIAMFVVQMINDSKLLIYSVDGEPKSKLKG